MVYLAGRDHLADHSNTRILLEYPGAALAHAAILQYRPVNTDVLPIFVLYHLLFAPLLWLLLRVPNATLGASLLLYVLVHVFGWTVPAWPNNVWFFNPLAWQLLMVFGAWWVIEGKRFWPWVTSRTALVLAVLYLAFSLIIALSCSIKPLEALVPQTLTNLLYPLESKSRNCRTRRFLRRCFVNGRQSRFRLRRSRSAHAHGGRTLRTSREVRPSPECALTRNDRPLRIL